MPISVITFLELLMKPSRVFSILGLSLSLWGCGEDAAVQPVPDSGKTVTIAGEAYPVVSAAGRSWTARNHRGPGGIPYRAAEDRVDYGRYYTYEEATAIPLPSGWRIPTLDDYKALAQSQGVVLTDNGALSQEAVRHLASTTSWLHVQGTNTSGFDAYPAGYSFGGHDPIGGDIAEFWAADRITFGIHESALERPHRLAFYQSSDSGYRFNVRFVKDE